MDKIYINLLVNQALQAYQQGGQDALDKWKSKLPAPHLAAFDQHCAGPLNEAIAALPKVEPVEAPDTEAEPKEDAPAEPQKKRDNDPRRTRPI